ncbi:hypothetical protein ACIQXF_02850 [Lysinibacillus sp. NPDC097231]|uniref:hypothetical protein n=1 Tax=Lysinibacillus sp. NPDC097231 TaxID=3364142 RepID=UPI003821A0F0
MTKELTCANCNRKIEEGEEFTATITMPSEKSMLVGRLDTTIAKVAKKVLCKNCN